MRPGNRKNDETREIRITRHFTSHAEGSVLVEYGQTKVICTASITPGVPRFLRDKKQGWLTAEYGMLPRSTNERVDREAIRGKQSGRTQEIQRLIGRSLRSAVDLSKLGDNTVVVDCDVIQADGGTRTASITGGYVALADAIRHAFQHKMIDENPLKNIIASVSVGIVDGEPRLDLEYLEDSVAETDMNIVMNDEGGFIEIQGTAEGKPFDQDEFQQLIALAQKGIKEIITQQKVSLDLV